MKKHKIIDPHAEREAQKYENPIPSREVILQYLHDCGHLARREEIIEALGISDPEQSEALRRRLRAMERDGQLIFTRREGYGIPDKMDLVRGRIIGHKEGYGFLVPDEGGGDLFISAYQMRSVFDGDKVIARVTGQDRRGRREGAIVEVLEHNTQSVVGRFLQENNLFYVVPNSKRINQNVLIPSGQQGNAVPGQIVMAEIITQPTLRMQAVGRVMEVLGEHLASGMEIEVAIRSYGLPNTWSEEVEQESARIPAQVTEAEKKGRVDIRKLPLVTIDGEDARDFDDAVFCQKKRLGGWTLYVAIADVSHYVRIQTALDQEAYKRGNSVYFPSFVVPMLPEVLSNELCSLKPEVDRLCMVCEMTISGAGKLSRYRFYKAVMHSHARLTYTEVAALLENGKKNISPRQKKLLPHLQDLLKLYKVLHKSRKERGAIDFDTVETRVIFGADRKIQQIVPVQRNVAHRIIEECMLSANVAAARFIAKHKLPNLFRIHEGPNPEKLQDLRAFLQGLGLRFPGTKEPKSKDYAELLEKVAKRPDARLIQTVLLRSLSQAIYSPENAGHFGLAFTEYAHFTSPIRRYPDLLLHRAIQHGLNKGKPETFAYDYNEMVNMGTHCSVTERRADEATRDAMDSLKCQFIKGHLGEEFEGIITGVTGFGLFVELEKIYIEGLLHVTSLKNDYYHYDAVNRCLKGERSGTVYHLGDKIRVKVARVDIDDREIDLDLVSSKTKMLSSTEKKRKIKKKAVKKKPTARTKKPVKKRRRK